MDALELGQVVFSKRGRDRGSAYAVVGTFIEDGKQYAYLADGKRRNAEKPKKKKSMHVQPTKAITTREAINEIGVDTGARNAYLRKILKKYSESLE